MRFKGKFLIIFFMIFLWLPVIGMLFKFNGGIDDLRLGSTKAFPEFKDYKGNAGKFFDELFEYYEDNFGFRYYFMKFASNLKIKLFKTYPKNIDVKVLKGKDGRLFYKLGNEPEDFQGRVPLSDAALKKIINEYENNLKFFNNSGIKFYVIIPPDKTVIYSDYLPSSMIYGIKSNKTRISQLLSLNSDFIYPKKELLDNKGENILYFKTDTHWTYYGAYFGYKALMEKIKQDFNIETLKLADMKEEKYVLPAPDLVNIVDIGTRQTENVPVYKCDNNIRKADLKVMVYGDSFMEFLTPYIKCTFKETSFYNLQDFNRENAILKKPDIVILEIVQRNLRHMFD